MGKLTPRFIVRMLLPASYLAFLAGALVSAAIFYRGRDFDVKEAILSDLASADANLHGYLAIVAGVVGFALLLTLVVAVFYMQLSRMSPRLAFAGAAFFAVGLASLVLIAALAPFTHGVYLQHSGLAHSSHQHYSLLHDLLAATAFLGLCAGTAFYAQAARVAPVLLAVQWAVVVVVAFMGYVPVEYDNNQLFSGLAFWEWGLCAYCAVALLVLAWAVERRR